MINLLKIFVIIMAITQSLKAQVGKVVILSKVVGDTISAEENEKYGLFPFFPKTTFMYAIFYKNDRNTDFYLLRGWFTDTIITRNITAEQFNWMKATCEKMLMILTEPTNVKPETMKFWGTAGGFAYSNLLSISVQKKHQLFSIRRGHFDDGDFLETKSYSVEDYALLYGIASKKKMKCASAILGPSLTHVTEYSRGSWFQVAGSPSTRGQITYEGYTIGISGQLEFAFTPLSFLGIGFYLTGNLNGVRPAGGGGISLRLGKLR